MIGLQFLGSGSAFTVGSNNFQSNILLVNENDEKLLLDCGSDIRFSLFRAGYSYLDISDIYISHLHTDHVGGLEYIGFNSKFNPDKDLPTLHIHEALKDDIWQKTLSGGMRYLDGKIVEIDSFFKLSAIPDNKYFVWSGIKFKPIQVIHINSKEQNLMPSYGLFFKINGQQIFLTTDTQFSPDELRTYYEQADVIFQDCETSSIPSNVHAHYRDLRELSSKIKSKMWLYGYQAGALPDAEADGFKGFVACGQKFKY